MNICRTCLSTEKKKQYISIFNTCDNFNILVVEMLAECCSVKITDEKDFPHKICLECIKLLHAFQIFRNKCLEAEKYFQNDIKENNIKIECEPMDLKDENNLEINEVNFVNNEDLTNNCFDGEEFITVEQENKLKIKKKRRDYDKKRSSPLYLYDKLTSSYSCKKCDSKFTDRKQMRKHRKEHTFIECPVCLKRCYGQYLYNLHKLRHEEDKIPTCEYCEKKFTMQVNLKRHIQSTHEGRRDFKCDLCDKTFTRKAYLKQHIQTFHLDDKGGHPRSYNGRGRRSRKKNEELPLPQIKDKLICTICQQFFYIESSYEKHLADHADVTKPKFKCDKCNIEFLKEISLRRHLSNTHGIADPFKKRLLCTECGRVCSMNKFKEHMNQHRGIDPYKCRFCGKIFWVRQSYVTHTRIHMNQRKYKCEICLKTFIQLTHLRYHMRTHTGEKPYECDICKKAFALKFSMDAHKRIHTGDRPFVCDACGQAFYDSGSRRKHQRQTHPEIQLTSKRLSQNNNNSQITLANNQNIV